MLQYFLLKMMVMMCMGGINKKKNQGYGQYQKRPFYSVKLNHLRGVCHVKEVQTKDLRRRGEEILLLQLTLLLEELVLKLGMLKIDKRAALTRVTRQTARDEESEALLSHLFHDFSFTWP